MNENNFLRQFVKKDNSRAVIVKKIIASVIFAIIFAIIAQLEAFRDQVLVAAIGLILIFSAILRNMSVEYEYTLSDGMFAVYKLSGVSKRALQVSVELNKISQYAKPDDENFEVLISGAELYCDLASSKNSEGRICFYAEEESLAFVIEPNEEMQNALLGGIKL